MSDAPKFVIPEWATPGPPGTHLDVLKESKLIQKLMVDKKAGYFFGRNAHLTDIIVDHASCSRVHAVLLYHKHLNRSFLVDLGSTHGTFIGTVRLESKKPTELSLDTKFHFGASTRTFVLRERPQSVMASLVHGSSVIDEIDKNKCDGDDTGGSLDSTLLGLLPESQSELDDLTEFNTASNRQRTSLPMDNVTTPKLPHGRLKKRVSYLDEDSVINPEDIDPTVGRFRNMVESTIIPNKRSRMSSLSDDGPGMLSSSGDKRVTDSRSASDGQQDDTMSPSASHHDEYVKKSKKLDVSEGAALKAAHALKSKNMAPNVHTVVQSTGPNKSSLHLYDGIMDNILPMSLPNPAPVVHNPDDDDDVIESKGNHTHSTVIPKSVVV